MTALPIDVAKKALRRSVRASLPDPGRRMEESERIVRRLLALPELVEAACVAAYMPLPQEADILPVLRQIRVRGIMLALPRCEADGKMVFCRVDDPDSLPAGMYGIREPATDMPVIPPDEIDCMLIPLEAADREGRRLGKGGGYYDRYLPQTDALRVGIALAEQLVTEVPCSEQDCRLHVLVTSEETLRFH